MPRLHNTTELAEVAGWEAALRLMEFAGGQSRFIPVKPSDEHWLTTVVGWEAAQRLCERYGGGTLLIPKGEADVLRFRNHLIRTAKAAGKRIRDIAIEFRLTERQVYNVLGAIEE